MAYWHKRQDRQRMGQLQLYRKEQGNTMRPRLVYANLYRLGASGMKRTRKQVDQLMINWLISELASHWAVKHKISVDAALRAIVLIMVKETETK